MPANSGGVGKYVGKGFNNSNSFSFAFRVSVSTTNTDTLLCAIPAHTDKDVTPVGAVAYTRAATGVLTPKAVAITSHQTPPDSGQTATLPVGTTVITPAVTLAVGDIVVIDYCASNFNAAAYV